MILKLYTLFERLKCFLMGHNVTMLARPRSGRVVIMCVGCSKVFNELKPICWIQVRRLFGSIDAFTRTFQDPESVPRAQRIQGSMCFPIYEGTQYAFGMYKGDSPADEIAIAESRDDDRKRWYYESTIISEPGTEPPPAKPLGKVKKLEGME